MSELPPIADGIDYRSLIESALKGVVRDLLRQVAAHGLPGDHHFYLTFRTDHPEVELPAFLRQRYPDEMTVVLQHQWSELEVGESRLSVRLRFDGRPQRLVIPFEALCGFADPAAQLALAFAAAASPAALAAADATATTDPVGGETPPAARQTGNLVSLQGFRNRRGGERGE